MDQEAVLRNLLDRQQIVDTLCRYASALDARDYDALRAVFAEDVEAHYGGREPMHGVDTVVSWIIDYGRTQAWQHHFVAVYDVTVEGDRATSVTYVTASQAPESDPRRVSTVHGAYHDELVRFGGSWRITRRRFDVTRRRLTSDV